MLNFTPAMAEATTAQTVDAYAAQAAHATARRFRRGRLHV